MPGGAALTGPTEPAYRVGPARPAAAGRWPGFGWSWWSRSLANNVPGSALLTGPTEPAYRVGPARPAAAGR